MKQALTIIKVGGKIVEEQDSLIHLLDDISGLPGLKLLVHGGGRSATAMAAKLGIETLMIEGRRVTTEEMLGVVTMVYAGKVNKNIVANLQARGINALGLTGADMNVICGHKREVKTVDYGWVGDVDNVDGERLASLISAGIMPVMAPLIHDGKGNMLNTNADTIAGETAKALARFFDVTLVFCFEKPGVLRSEDDDNSVISVITPSVYENLVADGIVSGGMLPKLKNAFEALQAGVKEVIITKANSVENLEKGSHLHL